jgi:hypothetical protein
MQVIELTTLAFATRRGYLVQSGEALGQDAHSRDVYVDDDIVVDEIERVARGWLVRFHAIHVRPW